MELTSPSGGGSQPVLPLVRDVGYADGGVRVAPDLVSFAIPAPRWALLPATPRNGSRYDVVVDDDPLLKFAGRRHAAVCEHRLRRHGPALAEDLHVPALRISRRVQVAHRQRA